MVGGALGCLTMALVGDLIEIFFLRKGNRPKLERGEIDCFYYYFVV